MTKSARRLAIVCLSLMSSASELGNEPAFRPQTHIAIVDGRWHINGKVTYAGAPAEGLLMNVRMVNCTFEDRRKSDFDAEANTNRFLVQIPDYAACGVRAFTLCLQGGHPGYEGAVNSAFEPDGSLRPEYLQRVGRVIEACDRQGVAVILGCFYQRQDQILRDADAVRAGLVSVVEWLRMRHFTNVVLETANEFSHNGLDHPILRTPEGQIGLIRLVKKTMPELLVSVSGLGDGRIAEIVAEAADFILIHFNSTAVQDVPARIAALKKYRKPIVVNEDDKKGVTAIQALELSVVNGASWGLMLNDLNQYQPFTFRGAADAPEIYARFKQLTAVSTSPSRDDPSQESNDRVKTVWEVVESGELAYMLTDPNAVVTLLGEPQARQEKDGGGMWSLDMNYPQISSRLPRARQRKVPSTRYAVWPFEGRRSILAESCRANDRSS